MRVLVSIKNKICVFWTPKAGCSTAVRIFFDHEGFFWDKKVWIHECRSAYQRDVHPSKLPDNISSFRKIQFVRDPYERAVSCYFVFKYHHNLNKSFLEFLEMVKDNSIKFCRHCETHSDIQFMTRDLDAIIRIENIHEDVRRVNNLFGLHFNSSLRQDPHSTRNKIKNSGGDPDQVYASLMAEPGVKDMIREIYAKDIQLIQEMSDFLFKTSNVS